MTRKKGLRVVGKISVQQWTDTEQIQRQTCLEMCHSEHRERNLQVRSTVIHSAIGT